MATIERAELLSKQVEDALREGIPQKHFGPGEQLPPENELAAISGVGRATVRAALWHLSAATSLDGQDHPARWGQGGDITLVGLDQALTGNINGWQDFVGYSHLLWAPQRRSLGCQGRLPQREWRLRPDWLHHLLPLLLRVQLAL
jgi:DNA-binding transcriptional MocR family regulator